MTRMCIAVRVQNPDIASRKNMRNTIEADYGTDDRTGVWTIEPAQTRPKDDEAARNNELADALGTTTSVPVSKVREIRIEMTEAGAQNQPGGRYVGQELLC